MYNVDALKVQYMFFQDAANQESKVEFYLDDFDDKPDFSYAKMVPGNFICILNPMKHIFLDGTVGFKIEHPKQVHVIEKHVLD